MKIGIISFLIIIVSVIFSMIMGIRWEGDSPTYFLMIESFAKDGDFILDDKDFKRWDYQGISLNGKEHYKVPQGAYMLLDKYGAMRYAKPVIYPLICFLPFFIFGIAGLSLLNGLFLGGSIVLAYFSIGKIFNKISAFFIAIFFFFCSFFPVYVSWIHPEMMLFFYSLLSMWLWRNKRNIVAAAFIIGIISSMRIEFILLFILLIIVSLREKKLNDCKRIVLIYLFGWGLIISLTYLFLGRPSAYFGQRFFIPSKMGGAYLSIAEIKSSLLAVNTMLESNEFNNFGIFLRNIAYFFTGRFTGIMWYAFPQMVCIGGYLFYRARLNRQDKILGDSVLLIMLLLVITLVILRPLNYFGGRGVVCNRYISILPILIFLPGLKAVKKPLWFILSFLPGLLISAQLISNERIIEDGTKRNIYHTLTFPLKYMPLEIAQVESFMIYNMQQLIREGVFLYPVDANREVVIVQEKSKQDVVLITESGNIILKPKVTLRNRHNLETKSFYYFKTTSPVLINSIQ